MSNLKAVDLDADDNKTRATLRIDRDILAAMKRRARIEGVFPSTLFEKAAEEYITRCNKSL